VVGIYSLRIDFLDDGQNLNWFELLPPITEIFIEAEDFDDESGISLEDTNDEGGGQNIGYIDEGDYVEYSITIPSDGNYLIEYRLASAVDSDGFTTSVGGVVVDSQTLLSTGDWQNWITQSSEVPLVAGEQTLRLDFLGGAINVNWIRLTRR
jgi:glucan 1,3-beta-glucosidase